MRRITCLLCSTACLLLGLDFDSSYLRVSSCIVERRPITTAPSLCILLVAVTIPLVCTSAQYSFFWGSRCSRFSSLTRCIPMKSGSRYDFLEGISIITRWDSSYLFLPVVIVIGNNRAFASSWFESECAASLPTMTPIGWPLSITRSA